MTTDPWPVRLRRRVRSSAPWLDRLLLRPLAERRHRRYLAREPAVKAAVIGQFGLKVQGGPFAGMEYLDTALNSGLLPKIVGCYESEIIPAVEEIVSRGYETVVDVGSAEGYYAVGLARAMPAATVYAFDVDPRCQQLTRTLAEQNGVGDRVLIRGLCDHHTLGEVSQGRVLVVSDCEGCELDLIDPAKAPALAGYDLLVELHDCLRPGITPAVVGRFEATHDIRLVDSERRDPGRYPSVNFLADPDDRRLAVDDLRGGAGRWAWMKARRPASATVIAS